MINDYRNDRRTASMIIVKQNHECCIDMSYYNETDNGIEMLLVDEEGSRFSLTINDNESWLEIITKITHGLEDLT